MTSDNDDIVKRAALSEAANHIYDKVIEHVNNVIKECELHGISSIIYIRDPSLEDRIAMIEKIIPLMQAIENLTKDLHIGLRMAESTSCFVFLKVLLQSVRLIDEDSFNNARMMLEKLATNGKQTT